MYRLFLLLLLSTPASLLAQTDSEPLDEIITYSKRIDGRFDMAGNIARLNEETLQTISALHIQDALVRVPGVNLQQGNGQEYLPAIRSPVLTGAGACGAVLTAQDNIPLRAAGFCNINELFEAYTEAARRIEVIRGPANALYGSNAMHGVVNVLLPDVPSQRRAELQLEAGPNDYRREHVSYGTPYGDQGLLFNLTATHDGGFRDDAYYDQQKMQLRHEASLTNWDVATTLTASNLNQETAGYIVGDGAYLTNERIDDNPDPQAYRDARSFRLYSRWEKTLADGQFLTLTPYLRKTDMDFLMHFLPGTPLEENGQDSAGLMLTYYADAGSSINMIAGLDVELTDGYLQQSQDSPTQGPPFLQATIPEGKHYDYDVQAVQLAPYIHGEWSLTERFSLDGGIRYEVMGYDYNNNMPAGRTRDDGTTCGFGGCRYSRPADREDVFRNWSPKIGALMEFTEDFNAFATLSHGFRAPQATELYRLQRQQVVADLDSVELTSLETGIRGRSQRWQYEINLYAMEKDNVIFRNSDFFNVSDGETRHRGAELDVFYQFSEDWDFRLVANYGDHTYSNDQLSGGINIKDNQVDTAPKRFGTAQLGLQLAENMRGELEFVHMGGYYTNPENTHRYPGHDLINFRAEWTPIPRLDLALRILNLSDERYAERADFSTFDGPRYFPGEPRSVYVGASYRF